MANKFNAANLFEVANYIIDKGAGATILKMQKLVYYSHAQYLVKQEKTRLSGLVSRLFIFLK
ncbi:hypothetical protein [Candidatus Phytoplasma pruni]|uniref:Uncharacterized protein n=1 Tax=Candidatus Phytoplasma pruni TaxID=479893 RepID=A0A851HGX3_9MOLU|nr:hypothetical protein [Candidatus Phytoplasma pruni]NWN45870.1 hypothetical protein [Candidatus Phytoplasma pruni]